MSQQINLFNPLFLKQKKYFSTVTMAQGLGLILLGMAAIYGYGWYHFSSVRDRLAQAERRLDTEQQRLTKYTAEYSPPRQSETLQEEIRKAESLVQSREEAERLLRSGVLGDTAGFSPYMKAFARQVVDGIWLTGFSISGAGADMAIEGRTLRAELVPLFIRRLGEEQVMRGRTFASLQMRRPPPEAPKAAEGAARVDGAPPHLEFVLRSQPAEKPK